MMVGWGGNNGTTVSAAIVANRDQMSWNTKDGLKKPNYYGSVVQASTLKLGIDETGHDVHIPFSQILPMVSPNDLVVGGWDISSLNIADAMERSKVLDYDLQRKVRPQLEKMKPLPSVYYPDFIAANQSDRADNVIPGNDKWAHVEQIRKDIRDFKQKNALDKVIIMWTANTERYADIIPGVNDTADNLLQAIKQSHAEVSPSTVFAIASILEKAPFINGSPQNTFVPGAIQFAEQQKVYIGGDDFKSGQTKIKSVLADFLVNAGIKPLSIVSYNHLGNNDGKNLSAPQQFRSKEISKASVVDDMVQANHVLYDPKTKEHPDHVIVIKYAPAVGDSKRAMDEYYSELMLNGRSTIAIHNTCEDSLLASPLIFDLVVLCELMTRIQYRIVSGVENLPSSNVNATSEFQDFHSVCSILSYMLKAPLNKPGHGPINSLAKQRMALENLFRACVGLEPNNEMYLEQKIW